MKVLGLFLPVLLLLGTPSMAVEFKGQNIDGQKLPARAYYYATGGLYSRSGQLSQQAGHNLL